MPFYQSLKADTLLLARPVCLAMSLQAKFAHDEFAGNKFAGDEFLAMS